MTRVIGLFLGLLTSVLLVSSVASAAPPTAPVKGRSGEWAVVVSSGGGFTGRTSSTRINSDGTVEALPEGPIPSERPTPAGRVSTATLKRLRAAIMAPDLLALRYSHPSNMTSSLEVVVGKTTRHYAWPFGSDDRLPPALARAARAARQAVAEAQRGRH